MRYFEVDQHMLEDARPGLQLVEQLLQGKRFRPYLFGITKTPVVLYAAERALERVAEDDEPTTAKALTQVAVALEFSSDTMFYLAGSGLLLQQEDFAYWSANEGVRMGSFRWSGSRPRLHLNDLTTMALSNDDVNLDEFLKQYGTQPTEAGQTHAIERPAEPAVKASALRKKATKVNPIDAFLK